MLLREVLKGIRSDVVINVAKAGLRRLLEVEECDLDKGRYLLKQESHINGATLNRDPKVIEAMRSQDIKVGGALGKC